MKIYGDVDFQSIGYSDNTLLNLAVETQYPASPTPGRVLFADGVVMICVEILSGVPVWVPLTQQISTYVYAQSTASDVWTITHNLNASSVIVQVIDINGYTIWPDSINTGTLNQVTITFNHAVTGRAVIMLGATNGVPAPDVNYTQSFSGLSTWTVTHGLGYYPNIQCFIGTYQVQPVSIVNNSTTIATVTFSSPETGYVICE